MTWKSFIEWSLRRIAPIAGVCLVASVCACSAANSEGSGTGSAGAGGASSAIGGTTATGGTTAIGGTSAIGGSATGGSATGGTSATGGSATGGTGGTAGTGATGGTGGTAGTVATGGTGGGSSACGTNQIATCTGNSPIACHFGGAPGNYAVTLELGGVSAGDAYVEAEAYRRMLAKTTTAAGETRSFSFVVNVRQPEGEPIQAVPSGTPGLDLYFYGAAARLDAICETPLADPLMVFIAGDSTVCDQTSTDYSGWGQHLPQHFLSPVSVANYADSGESSVSFSRSGSLWGAIKSRVSAGDWVLIQFGHNDKTTDEATFRTAMTLMVNDTKAAGAHPILFTPTSRVGYALADEHVNSVGVNLPAVIKDLGATLNVPVVNLTTITWNWLQTVTWQDYYALGTDRTHTNPKGAEVIAGFVRDGIAAQAPALVQYLR